MAETPALRQSVQLTHQQSGSNVYTAVGVVRFCTVLLRVYQGTKEQITKHTADMNKASCH